MGHEGGSLLWEGDFVVWAGPESTAGSVPIPPGHPGVVQSTRDADAVGIWWVDPGGYLSFDEVYDQDWLERVSAEHYRVQSDRIRAGLLAALPARDFPPARTAPADSRFGEDPSHSASPLRAVRRPWVRGELPWLRSGPLFGVEVAAEPDLIAFLDRFGYRRVDLDGRLMTSRAGVHQVLARAFDFPASYGANWDAFDDYVNEYLGERTDHPVGVVWRDFDVAAQHAPVPVAEAAWALIELHLSHVRPDRTAAATVDVFVLGRGEEYDQPARP